MSPAAPPATDELLISSLMVHPVKSCAGIAVDEALLIETGLEHDRAWMVVDSEGEFVSQRELPRMALVRPTLRASDVVLRAPGMLALHLLLDTVEAPCRVKVWSDIVAAYDMGDLAAQWFSDFLGQRVRLARFDPATRRLCDPAWTGPFEAETAFADGGGAFGIGRLPRRDQTFPRGVIEIGLFLAMRADGADQPLRHHAEQG